MNKSVTTKKEEEGKCIITLGEGGRGLGIKVNDEGEHGDENATATHAADATESSTKETDEGTDHNPPPKLQLLQIYVQKKLSREYMRIHVHMYNN